MAATISGSGTSTLIDLTTSGNTTLGDASTDTLNVGNGGLVKDASGNVGIGHNSPSSKLSVGTASYAQATSVAQVNGTSQPTANSAGIFNIGCTDAAAADVGGSLGFTANGGINGYPAGQISCRRDSATSSVYSTYMAFTTSNSGGTISEKMRLDASGNLSVGSTTANAFAPPLTLSKSASYIWGAGPLPGTPVLPEAVNVQDDEQKTLGVQYTEVIPLLVAAIQEQQALITQLQADVAALKGATP
jgi:hypothetical protein